MTIRSENDRLLFLDNSCLLPGNVFTCTTKDSLVIESYGGNDAQFAGDDVCCIQTTPTTDFNNGNVNLFLFEIQKGNHCCYFKKTCISEFVCYIKNGSGQGNKLILRYKFAINCNSLSKARNLRTCIETDLVTAVLDAFWQFPCSGSLSIGSCDVNRPKTSWWIV